jgi:sortase A
VAYISPGDSEVTEIQAIDPTVTAAVHEAPTLMIPKLNIEVPIIMNSANDVQSMQVAMLDGVANFKTSVSSAMPGEIGNFAVSGHSAGNIYDTRSRYKFIFSGLTRMEAGDMIYVDYNGSRYSYRVQGAVEVEQTNVQELANISRNNPGKPMITLITCTPLGTSKYRLLVYGEQIHPSYEGAEEPDPTPVEEEENIATGIDGFATDNGFIVIDDNTPLYNLSGQRVSKSYKGIVIVNGKKVLRK